MKIVKPYAKIMDPEAADIALRNVEYAARISHRSEEETGLNTEKFIRAVVLQHGDWSVVEHVSVSVEFLVDRGITHEIVRHRIASYTQESTRFVNYAKKMPPSFIYPKPHVRCSLCEAGDEPQMDARGVVCHIGVCQGAEHNQSCGYSQTWLRAINMAEECYRMLLHPDADQWRPQEARSVFPNALASKIVMTCNLRSWRHFFLRPRRMSAR